MTAVLTQVYLYMYIGWNWCMTRSGDTLSFLKPLGFHEGLAFFFCACEAKPTISSMRPQWSNTRSKGSRPVCSAFVQECSSEAERLPSVNAGVKGWWRDWTSLCPNLANTSKCLLSKWGMQSWVNEGRAPTKMHAVPAAKCPLKSCRFPAADLTCLVLSSAHVHFIKPLNCSLLLGNVHCSLIFWPVTPWLMQHMQAFFCSGFMFATMCKYIWQKTAKTKNDKIKVYCMKNYRVFWEVFICINIYAEWFKGIFPSISW